MRDLNDGYYVCRSAAFFFENQREDELTDQSTWPRQSDRLTITTEDHEDVSQCNM